MQFFSQIPQNLVYMVKILFLNKLKYINNARATHSGVSRGKTVVLATATGNHLPIAESQTRFCRHYRAENLCYQFDHGQKFRPQFRKIVGLVIRLGGTPTPDFMPLFWQPQRAITCPLRRAKLGFAATTAPKIFAINLVTDKNSCRNFARLSAWYFRLGVTPTPETKTNS